MAKIDTSKIENYDNMTSDEKLAAILAMEVDDTSEIDRYKNAASKANSEAAAFKKTAKDSEARIADLEKKLADMEKEKRVANLRASYLKLGFDEDLAEKTAQAYVAGDDETVFANHAAVNAAREKDAQAASLKNMPRPAGGGEKKLTRDDIYKTDERGQFVLDAAQRQEALTQLIASGE